MDMEEKAEEILAEAGRVFTNLDEYVELLEIIISKAQKKVKELLGC